MRIRIKSPLFAAFLGFSFVLSTFSGLAGFLSVFAALILPVYLVVSILHLALSWYFFTFHQTFSTDHPLKGESVQYRLYMENSGPFPLARGTCGFSSSRETTSGLQTKPIPVSPFSGASFEETVQCAYRGTYTVGLISVSFKDTIGMIEFEETIEPHIFYVYPELVSLDQGIERITGSSGADRADHDSNDEDASIYEYVSPVRTGENPRRVNWKRWAATGIPSRIVSGNSVSSSLKVVLDLWPEEKTDGGRLASEDRAITAAFSVLKHLCEQEIPCELVLGSRDEGIPVGSMDEFQALFDQSTGILFDDPGFPQAAFNATDAVLLISNRPLAESSDSSMDLFSAHTQAALSGREPHLLLCPSPSRIEGQKTIALLLDERNKAVSARALVRISDPLSDAGELQYALCT